jgi:hypothetical protein
MFTFYYTAEAELFPPRNWRSQSRGVAYKRFWLISNPTESQPS